MAVPYPPDGRVGYSQDKDHRVAVASRVIRSALDEQPTWDSLSERIADRLRLRLEVPRERATVQDTFLTAELDLEWTNLIVYENGHFRRPGRPDDPTAVPPEQLRDVADAVLGLGWPNPRRKRSRTIYECFIELNGRYRHCDVYWAMHKYLKGNRLRAVRANWMLQDDVETILGDSTLTPNERAEIETELEKELVDAYVEWLGRRIDREYRFANGRQSDLYDHQRRLIVEAKANCRDDVVVAHAMGQAMYYRSIDPEGLDAHIAVLLLGEPSEDAARLLRIYDVGLIFRQGDRFVEQLA